MTPEEMAAVLTGRVSPVQRNLLMASERANRAMQLASTALVADPDVAQLMLGNAEKLMVEAAQLIVAARTAIAIDPEAARSPARGTA